MAFWDYLWIGTGKFKPELRRRLEAEGVVLLEEGLRARIRYDHFKAPGKRFHGKVTGERVGLAITEMRFAVYCRSGVAELIDSPFDSARWGIVDFSIPERERLAIHVDYEKATDQPQVSGEITITIATPSAETIRAELEARIGRGGSFSRP